MKSALVHDWLMTFGGAEKVLEAIYERFPSPIFTLFHQSDVFSSSLLGEAKIITSFLQKFPKIKSVYRYYFPFYPLAIENFDISEYDLIISSSHAVAKGVLSHAGQLHICFCHTPMRYAWDLYFQYLKESGLERGIKARIAKFFLHYMRLWDYGATPRVDAFVANSRYIARRIAKVYGRTADVIYPPVDIDRFELCESKEDFYITVSRLVPYKKIDLIVEAFSLMPSHKLVVIGDGPDMNKVKAKASTNIEILGYQSDETLRKYLKKAKAFIYAAEEDFGISPVEAQACGTPVIAYGKGGVRETVLSDVTGLFFNKQSVLNIIDAVTLFETKQEQFQPTIIREQAKKFGKKRFQDEFQSYVERKWQEFQ